MCYNQGINSNPNITTMQEEKKEVTVKKTVTPEDEGFKEQFDEVKEAMEQKAEAEAPKLRQIVIETDGNAINIVKSEVAGKIELTAILQNVIAFINQPAK